jgi:tRNA (mo5U34)-methyltransferase
MRDIRREIQQYFWFHSIDLGNDIVTPGIKSQKLLAAEAQAIFGPCNLVGRSVLDIGAWNGFFTFEAKKRGAARVLATDQFCWTHPQYRGKETFDLARDVLQIDVEDLEVDAPDLSLERVGSFDVVLFLGIFYHLVDPIRVLQNIAPIATESLVIETHLDLQNLGRPAMAFYPGKEVNNDPTNWWGPNREAMESLLRMVGFDSIEFLPHPVAGRGRGIFHARRKGLARAS